MGIALYRRMDSRASRSGCRIQTRAVLRVSWRFSPPLGRRPCIPRQKVALPRPGSNPGACRPWQRPGTRTAAKGGRSALWTRLSSAHRRPAKIVIGRPLSPLHHPATSSTSDARDAGGSGRCATAGGRHALTIGIQETVLTGHRTTSSRLAVAIATSVHGHDVLSVSMIAAYQRGLTRKTTDGRHPTARSTLHPRTATRP